MPIILKETEVTMRGKKTRKRSNWPKKLNLSILLKHNNPHDFVLNLHVVCAAEPRLTEYVTLGSENTAVTCSRKTEPLASIIFIVFAITFKIIKNTFNNLEENLLTMDLPQT